MERKDASEDVDERKERQEREEALRDFERDAGENYEVPFGKLFEDTPQAEIDEAEREDR